MDDISCNTVSDSTSKDNQPTCTNSNEHDEKPIQQRIKRKHRRGKPKPKNTKKQFKNTNWKFQVPRFKYNRISVASGASVGGGNGNVGSGGGTSNCRQRSRAKLIRSNSLAPYNTNKFLMEEHMVEVPTLLTPTGRTRESSFSVDSEDNYFFSLPEDEEDFLTKEFSNVYEVARVERLENLSKQELIQECLQMEDRYASDQGSQQQLNLQRITTEFMSRIKSLEQKIKELSRENYNLRCQLVQRSTTLAASAASPPSATAPTSAASAPMITTSEDTDSDSSSTSSSSSSSSSTSRDDKGEPQRRSSFSSNSNFSDNRDDEYIEHGAEAMDAEISSDRDQNVPLHMEYHFHESKKSVSNISRDDPVRKINTEDCELKTVSSDNSNGVQKDINLSKQSAER